MIDALAGRYFTDFDVRMCCFVDASGNDNGGNDDKGGAANDGVGSSSDASSDPLSTAGDPTGLGTAPGTEIDTLGGPGPDTIDATAGLDTAPATMEFSATANQYGMAAGIIGTGLAVANAAVNGSPLGAVAAGLAAIGMASNPTIEQAAVNVATDVLSGMGVTGQLAADDPQGFGTFGTTTSGTTSTSGGFGGNDGSSGTTVAYYNEWAVSSQGGGG